MDYSKVSEPKASNQRYTHIDFLRIIAIFWCFLTIPEQMDLFYSQIDWVLPYTFPIL